MAKSVGENLCAKILAGSGVKGSESFPIASNRFKLPTISRTPSGVDDKPFLCK